MNDRPGASTITAVIVDDQPMMRVALRTVLESAGIEVVGEAPDGDEAIRIARDARPDVVLMDVRMPRRDGIAATQELAADGLAGRVLVLTTFDDDDYLDGALRAGASGFLLKNSPPEELVRAVRLVAAGDAVLDPAVTRRIVRHSLNGQVRRSPDIERLTEREKDVLALLAGGLSNAELAAALGVGEATAKTHVSHVIAKLGVRDRVQAVILAFETGFAPSGRAIATRLTD